MIAYLGMTRSKDFVRRMNARNIGRIMQRGQLSLNSLLPGERWAFDNGAFQDWTNGRMFDLDQHRADMRAIHSSKLRPVFAVTPDKVASPESLAFSCSWKRDLSAVYERWNWYLVVQDGMTVQGVRDAVLSHNFRGLFLGGSDSFKGTAATWSQLAHELGLPAHYGRAGTPAKIRHAYECGYDSFDSSFPLWDRGRFSEFIRIADKAFEDENEVFDW